MPLNGQGSESPRFVYLRLQNGLEIDGVQVTSIVGVIGDDDDTALANVTAIKDYVEANGGTSESPDPRGHIAGPGYYYKDADEIYFLPFSVEIDGTIYHWATLAAVNMATRLGSSLAADTWYKIYINPPASGTALSSAEFEVSTDAPEETKSGWYHDTNTDWRCIGAFWTDSSGNIRSFKALGGVWRLLTPYRFLDDSTPATSRTAVSTGAPALGPLLLTGHYHADNNSGANENRVRVRIYDGGGSGINNDSLYQSNHSTGAAETRAIMGGDYVAMTDDSQQIEYYMDEGALIQLSWRQFALPAGMLGR